MLCRRQGCPNKCGPGRVVVRAKHGDRSAWEWWCADCVRFYGVTDKQEVKYHHQKRVFSIEVVKAGKSEHVSESPPSQAEEDKDDIIAFTPKKNTKKKTKKASA